MFLWGLARWIMEFGQLHCSWVFQPEVSPQDRSRPRATLQRNPELRSSLPGMSALELLAGRANSGNGLSTRFESDYFARHLVSRSRVALWLSVLHRIQSNPDGDPFSKLHRYG
jgi:hypothetical protein